MKKRFILSIVTVLLVVFFSIIWWNQAIAPVNKKDASYKIFVIKRGEDVRSIAKHLQSEGLIRDPIAFFLLVRFGGIKQEIQSGDFRLSPSENIRIIANTLTHGTLDIWVTTVEGWRSEEIASKLSQTMAIPESEFMKVAKEGYMFPDTYLLPRDSSASSVATVFMNNFNRHITSDIKSEALKKGLSINDLVIFASLVEREARYDEDRPIVASILLNRYKLGMPLDVDATVQYAIGYQAEEKTWWKKNLTEDDLKIKSPYNTYLNTGLPPAAISNPGMAAIKAIINAPTTEYLYYVSDSSGRIHPAKTINEHNGNVQKYLNK